MPTWSAWVIFSKKTESNTALSGFDKQTQQQLQITLAQLQGRDAVLSYQQLQGLLFAIACSPELIKPAEWFDLIWLDDEPQFDTKDEAHQFYNGVVAMSKHVADKVEQGLYLPFGKQFAERWQEALSQWCEGMLLGHHYLEELWMIAVDDLDDQQIIEEVDATLSLASTFADIEGAQQLSFEEGIELGDEHLPEAYELFWQALDGYAHTRIQWAAVANKMDVEQLFLALEPVAHDQLCPCGSGLRFGKCCLH